MNSKFLYSILLLISFLEGGVLMSFEILSSKLYTPYLGSSIYVWTSILTLTLSGLALGYKIGGKLSIKDPIKYLIYSLGIATILIGITPFIAKGILESLLNLNVKTASIIGGFLLIFFPITALGIVSPLLVGILSDQNKTVASSSGLIYGIGTIGGIILVLISTFYLIPNIGVKNSILSMSGLLLISVLLVIFYKKRSNA